MGAARRRGLGALHRGDERSPPAPPPSDRRSRAGPGRIRTPVAGRPGRPRGRPFPGPPPGGPAEARPRPAKRRHRREAQRRPGLPGRQQRRVPLLRRRRAAAELGVPLVPAHRLRRQHPPQADADRGQPRPGLGAALRGAPLLALLDRRQQRPAGVHAPQPDERPVGAGRARPRTLRRRPARGRRLGPVDLPLRPGHDPPRGRPGDGALRRGRLRRLPRHGRRALRPRLRLRRRAGRRPVGQELHVPGPHRSLHGPLQRRRRADPGPLPGPAHRLPRLLQHHPAAPAPHRRRRAPGGLPRPDRRLPHPRHGRSPLSAPAGVPRRHVPLGRDDAGSPHHLRLRPGHAGLARHPQPLGPVRPPGRAPLPGRRHPGGRHREPRGDGHHLPQPLPAGPALLGPRRRRGGRAGEVPRQLLGTGGGPPARLLAGDPPGLG